MIQNKKWVLLALLFPILSLLVVVTYRQYSFSHGKEVVLPISGYDPTDVLAGHYLTYTVNYNVSAPCSEITSYDSVSAYFCLDTKTFSKEIPQSCPTFIKGKCQYLRFEAGIERFYIPESHAKDLDAKIRAGTASILISVTEGGHAMVKDLLINGKSWKE